MPACEDFVLMAAYNAAMNRNVYAAAATLTPAELVADRQAFFGSLLNTLSHIVVADIVWLQRFRQHPAAWPALAPMAEFSIPTGLAERIADDLAALALLRTRLDAIISAWVAQLQPAELQQPFAFRRMNGEQQRKNFGSVLLHFFNHQTHHRGQASTLLFQQGVDIGVTDLLAWVPQLPD